MWPSRKERVGGSSCDQRQERASLSLCPLPLPHFSLCSLSTLFSVPAECGDRGLAISKWESSATTVLHPMLSSGHWVGGCRGYEPWAVG